MRGLRHHVKRAVTGLVTVLVAAGGSAIMTAQPAAADVAPVQQRSSTSVTADSLPTTQINGVVWDQVVVGDTVYVGGQFTSARPAGSPAGTNETPRSNLLAYNIRTGNLITSFAPVVDAQVKAMAVSPDQKKLYIAGSFTKVNGANRYRVASFDVATGALNSFAPAANSTVNGIAATSSAVYLGGIFSKIGSVDRGRLAAVNPTNGALLGWAPTADATVQAVLPTPDKSRIIVAGAFANLNGSTATGLGAIDAVSGASLPWTANTVVRNYGTSASMLKLRTDGQTVYAVGYWFGGTGNFEGVLAADPNSGDVKWLADCHGDTYDTTAMNDYVYAVSHWHYCTNIGGFPDTNPRKAWYHGTAMTKEVRGTVAHNGQGGYYDFYGYGAPALVNWFPDLQTGTYTGKTQAAWSATSTNEYLLLGGEFPKVNGVPQYGLARFAISSIAPKKMGPAYAGAAANPTLQAVRPDQLRIKWQANTDPDDQQLTYNLYRIGTATPVYTATATSQFWNRPTLSFTDTGLTPGANYRYRLQISDPDGNTAQSEIVSTTMPTSIDPYVSQVLDDNASNYWRMENSGTLQADLAGTSDLITAGGTDSASGALQDPNPALTFNGGDTGTSGTTQSITGPSTFSAEAWIKTTTTSGGKILGFGGNSTGASSSYDRHIYMENSGRLTFGVYPNSVQTVSSAKAYNDGQWHHVVAELSSAGMVLYVDGLKVAANAGVTSAQSYDGFWRVGGDNLNGWTNQPNSFYFNGTIDEVAIYPSALTVAQVRDHYTKSGRTVDLPAGPTDSYGKAVAGDDPALYWRLNEADGGVAADASATQSNGTYVGGVNHRTASPVSDPKYAATFNGSDGFVVSNQTYNNPKNYSLEAWFNTTSNSGGKIIGFGSSNSGTSGSYDRHIYMNNDGRVTFGVWTGFTNTITTDQPLNNGQWHHVVATQSSNSGMALYVDGAQVGTNPQTDAQDYTGFWRVGGDNHWGCCSAFLAASIDEVAVYNSVLTPAQVQSHYQASGAVVNANPVAAFDQQCSDGQCAFTSTSNDPDGTIDRYDWAFGDGTDSTEANPSHTYGASGTYSVKLTVTDNKGASASVIKSVTVDVPAPNTPPAAAFTSTCNEWACTFDSAGSNDPDGTITGYAWTFGDGAASSEASPSHTFGANGTYQVGLTVTDNRGGTASTSHQVTVRKNVAPVVDLKSSCDALICNFDASGSTDDHQIADYAWNFGDGKTGNGATTSHTYTAAGTYTVQVTVSDDDGAATTKSTSVTVAPAPAGPLVADDFGRTVSKWGTADHGGTWTYSGSTFSTNGQTGSIQIGKPGATASAYLDDVSAQDVDVLTDISVDKMATGGGTYNYLLVRRNGNSDYRATFQELSDGRVRLTLSRTVNGAGTTLRQVNLSGVSYSAGDTFRVRFSVTGSGTTTLGLKVWKVGSSEPADPQVSSTDTTASLQNAGSFGISGYVSGSSSNTPVTVNVDNLRVTAG